MFIEMNSDNLPINTSTASRSPTSRGNISTGFFAGLAARGQFRFGDVEPAPAADKKVSLEDLIFEERVKHELHPLDAYRSDRRKRRRPTRRRTRRKSSASNGTASFSSRRTRRRSWRGCGFPAACCKTFQLRELASIAKELTTGYVQITTRANLQMRLIQPKDAPEFLRRIQSVGLHTRGAGADNIRNLTANPTAGIDPHELIDVMPFCHETRRRSSSTTARSTICRASSTSPTMAAA